MKLLKVAAGVLNQTPLDWEGNRDNIVNAIAAAQRAKRFGSVLARTVHHRLRL